MPLNHRNLIARAAQEPFAGWSRPLTGLDLRVHSAIPVGCGLGSSAAAIVAGIILGAKLRGLRIPAQRILDLAFPLEGHGDNLAAALYGGFCIAVSGGDRPRVHKLPWPAAWRPVVYMPMDVSPTHQARKLVPRHPAREDVVFNLGRVAEWILACTRKDRSLLASAMQDRLHQPARAPVYPYLKDTIAAAVKAGALGAALSGAGGGVIAIADRHFEAVALAMVLAARTYDVTGSAITLRAAPTGPRL